MDCKLLVVLLGLATLPGAAAAQATLRGRVIDSEMGTPLAGANIRIQGVSTPLTTDSLGRFEARDLKRGEVEVTVRLIGFEAGVFTVYIPASGTLEGSFALDFNGFELPAVVVQARAEQLMPRYVDFERRRQRGIGTYLRWDDLKKQGAMSIGDALRTVRGVRIQCDQQKFECFARMARTPGCQPTWWIDGVEVRSFHENTPIRDVYGIEIYRGPGEIPAEYGGSNAMCGVIVVWTKSRPYVQAPPP